MKVNNVLYKPLRGVFYGNTVELHLNNLDLYLT